MRTLALLILVTPLAGCFVDQSCAGRPNDPLCQPIDSGLPPSDTHGSGTDGGVIACVPTCAGTQVCDTTTGFCVGCVDSSTCTDVAAAFCDPMAHTCGACTQSSQCGHLPITPVCHSGTCVQCNTNDDCDATHGCDPSTHACVTVMPNSKMLCDSCLRDSECQVGQLCVPMAYHGANVGNFCAWRVDMTRTGMDCTLVRPFVNVQMEMSTDGVSAMMCLLRSTTCAARADFAMPCPSTPAQPMSSPSCGPNMDGFCQHNGANYDCTVGCTNSLDCPCTDGTCAMQYTCSGGFCNLGSTCSWDMANHTCH